MIALVLIASVGWLMLLSALAVDSLRGCGLLKDRTPAPQPPRLTLVRTKPERRLGDLWDMADDRERWGR